MPNQPCFLVTGSMGLIGSRFFELYQKDLNLISADIRDGFDVLDQTGLINKTKSALAGRHLDAIIHLAAYTDVSAAHLQEGDQSGLCYRLNVNGTENAVALADAFGSHLVYVSTDFVFDGEGSVPIDEKTAPNPIEWYGQTKLLGEEVVRNSAQSWTIMRIAFPYLREEGARPDLVVTIRKRLREGDDLFLFGDQCITPTFGDDIAVAMRIFAETAP